MALRDLFIQPDHIDAVFFKIVTHNDDSGRHGVLVPKEAYPMFPEFGGFKPGEAVNYTEPIRTFWRLDGTRLREQNSNWKHYHRYPERRVTALRCPKLDQAPADTLILFGRRGHLSREYEVEVLYPGERGYAEVLDEFDFDLAEVTAGLFGMDLRWRDHGEHTPASPALDLFLKEFDRIEALGHVRSKRRGPTGVGYTFEELMGIAENNKMTGDFMGMEIKTFRSQELRMQSAEKMNLFLKEPVWLDGLEPADRVRRYGYVDPNGREALYSTVGITPSGHGFAFDIDDVAGCLYLLRNGERVARWNYSVLEKRLREKHTEAVFVAAHVSRRGGEEHFHYRSVTHCMEPSIEAFISLIAQGDVVLELRMHIRENGSVRNHGSGFRVRQNCLAMLYGTTVHVRGAQTGKPVPAS